ncbi:mavicyanin [Vigna unguiculata]|uniref:Cupredoxin n=1 Tax=Vigna unguiculata TaxID=3917 RepID=A0A4D6M973_VIGUN|nr:mavicyanin [Vigna unguiculata]QCD96666.1 Cupredoxin [Vigna unguiculata]
MGHKNTIFLALIIVLITNEGMAEQHAVGGSQGWDASTDFKSWVSGQTFNVGDQLVFKYSSGLHSVVELGSESEYKNCDVGNAVNSMSSGNDVVKLNKPGTRYFACGTLGHCGQGMKVKITTVSGTSSSSSSSSSSPTSSSASHCFTSLLLIVASFIASLLTQF